MAISIAQYVDLLFKKLQGVAKTANATVKGATNESIASPAFLRGDVIWVQSDQIGNTAGAIAGVANARTGTNAVECVGDTTVPPIGGVRPTWLTNVSYWISQEFGSTWLPKVFVGPSGAANIEATGTQIFAAGIGGVGEYYFDTQAGVLNFIGETIPTVLSAGNVVYISGYEYIGLLGTTNLPGNTSIGNIVVANTTITTDGTIANVTITPTASANGLVIIDAVTGMVLPSGNTAQRPGNATVGTIRYNSSTEVTEVFTGTEWISVGNTFGSISTQVINGDNTSNAFSLNQEATANSIIVINNGVVQQPDVAYSVTGNTITFAEPPAVADTVTIRFVSPVITVNEITNDSGINAIAVDPSGVGNLSTTQSVQLPTYSVAQAANLANTAAGQVIYVTNGDSGSPCLAVFASGNWKRVALGANIST